jgi:gluconolactonase
MADSVLDHERVTGLIAPDATVRRLGGGASWSEGPVWLPTRRVLRWSDIPGNRILEIDPASGESSIHRSEVEFTNGRTLAPDGSVIQCSHGRRAIEREADGEVTILVDSWEGRRLNSPNDVVVARDGSIWFTDPPYGIVQPHEGHPGEPEYGGNFVFRFEPTTGELRPVVTDMEEPNGLAFSPDESVLYISDTSSALRTDGTGNHHIRAYDVNGAACENGRVFAVVEPGVPDGFRVDVDGNVWTSSADSVQVYSPNGHLLERIPVPEVVGNLCFGGPDGSELFIAASTSIYTISTLTRGATTGAPSCAQ